MPEERSVGLPKAILSKSLMLFNFLNLKKENIVLFEVVLLIKLFILD